MKKILSILLTSSFLHAMENHIPSYIEEVKSNFQKWVSEHDQNHEISIFENKKESDYKWPLMKDVFDLYDKMDLISFLLSTDRYSYGEKIKQFEQDWNNWLGSKYSVFVNSGSSANLILIAAVKEKYNLKEGDKVLVPACTWSTNINPLIQCGLEPIFCDINFDNFSFDQNHLLKIKEKHQDIKIIFITHLLGLPSDITLLKDLFPDSILLEDCCESHGATYQGKKVGTLSEAGTFSFFFGHHMTTIEGGMISTNDEELYKLLCLKRSHGLARELPKEDFEKEAQKYQDINKRFLFLTDGYNVRSTELNAVLGIRQLKKIDFFIDERQKNYKKFLTIIQKYSNLFYVPKEEGNSSFCLPLVCKEKNFFEILEKNLEKEKIEIRPIVGSNLVRQPFLQKYKINASEFKNADILHFNGVYIANNQFLTQENFDLLERAIQETLLAYSSK